MEDNQNPVTQAADQIKAAAATEKPKRAPRKPKAPAELPPETAPVVTSIEVSFAGIGAEDVSKTVNVLLVAIANATKTDRPRPEEVGAISDGLATGLKHTKVALDPNTGPWVPLGLACTAYALPRIIDVVMRKVAEREAAKQSNFPDAETDGQPLEVDRAAFLRP